MPSERARPLVAFAVVAVVCGLVVVTNMLRHPETTVRTVEAAAAAQVGPRVEFGSVLATRPRVEAPAVGNVLGVALSRPVTTPLARTAIRPLRAAPSTARSARPARPRAHTHSVHQRLHHHATVPTAHPGPPGHGPSGHGRGHGSSVPSRGPGHSGSAPGQVRKHARAAARARGSAAPVTALASVVAPGHSGQAPGHRPHGPGTDHGRGQGKGHADGPGRGHGRG